MWVLSSNIIWRKLLGRWGKEYCISSSYFLSIILIEFGGNFKYTDSLVLFVQTTDSNQSMRFPENMVLFIEWHCSSHIILPLFWFFFAFKGQNCWSSGCLNVLSDRWQGQMIDESSNQRLSPVDEADDQFLSQWSDIIKPQEVSIAASAGFSGPDLGIYLTYEQAVNFSKVKTQKRYFARALGYNITFFAIFRPRVPKHFCGKCNHFQGFFVIKADRHFTGFFSSFFHLIYCAFSFSLRKGQGIIGKGAPKSQVYTGIRDEPP